MGIISISSFTNAFKKAYCVGGKPKQGNYLVFKRSQAIQVKNSCKIAYGNINSSLKVENIY